MLIYVDESGIDQGISRKFARAPRGQKIYGKISGKRIKRQSILAAQVNNKIIAPMIFEGTCYAELFEAWVEQVLVPELQPGQVIIMDNAAFHKSSKTKELIEKAGCELLFLPPYSPHLNPIEQFWGVLKRKVSYLVTETISAIHALCTVLNEY